TSKTPPSHYSESHRYRSRSPPLVDRLAVPRSRWRPPPSLMRSARASSEPPRKGVVRREYQKCLSRCLIDEADGAVVAFAALVLTDFTVRPCRNARPLRNRQHL